MILGAITALSAQLAALRDGVPDDGDDDDACEPGEAAWCAAERDALHLPGRIEDLEQRAASAVYANGKVKRTLHPRVRDMSKRRVVIVLHQTGVERPSSSKRWHLITAHRAIKPDGTRSRLHPLDVRLIAANRLDRAPWHAISIEVGGNFEGVDGSRNWYRPDVFGRGRASDVQLAACREEVVGLIGEVAVQFPGAQVEAIVPHIVAGRDSKGRPNRPLCCGSRVWSEVGEWAGAELGLKVPGNLFAIGGTPVPSSWHGRHWERCFERLAA